MLDRSAPRRHLTLAAALFFGSALFALPLDIGHAGDAPVSTRTLQPYSGTRAVPRTAFGGYSTTMSEIWGLPEMPPAPKDFGPHFDFPAGGSESLNGPPDRSPYSN